MTPLKTLKFSQNLTFFGKKNWKKYFQLFSKIVNHIFVDFGQKQLILHSFSKKKKKRKKKNSQNEQVVLEPRVSPEHTWKYVDTVIVLAKTWTKGHWPLDDLWPHICWGLMCDYSRIIVSKSQENTSKYVDTVTFFAKTWSKGHWPLGDLWPHICWGHMCDSTQGSFVQVPWKYIKVCGYSDLFCKKKLEPKVIDP